MSVAGPAILDREVASLDPSQLPQAVFERDHARLCLRVASDKTHQHADPPHLLGLRARRKRPRDRRPAEKRDEIAPFHSITSSASESSIGGRSRPSVLAVFRLITSSNLLGCMTGRSAGFVPLRILPACTPS